MTSRRKRDMVLHWHKRGIDDATIVRLLNIPPSEINAIVEEAGS